MHTVFSTHARRPGRLAATVLGLLLALASVAQAAPTPSATPTFDPNNPKDQKLQVIFQRFDAKRGVVEGNLVSIGRQLADIETQLIALHGKLADAQADLAKRQKQYQAAVAKLNAQKALLKQSAAAIYIRGPWTYLDAMLNADDISSLTRVDVYAQSVLGDFVRVLHEVADAKKRVQKIYLTVRQRTLEIAAQTAQVEQQESQIMQRQQQAFAQRQSLINGLVADFGGLAALKAHGFDVIVQAEAGAASRVGQKLTDFQTTEDQRNVQNNATAEDTASLGEYVLQWPVDSRRITSRYGWRIHPVWGYRSFHTGIDIGADYGQPVYAAADGVVVDVGYMGADGVAIVIDHDHHIGTVYAHLSKTTVTPGDRVKAGDTIGEIGCTGWCTGPHLHFEVRVNSQPTNPIFWL